jgi:hypothetical protein
MPCSTCAKHTSWNFGITLSYGSRLVKEKAVAMPLKIRALNQGVAPYHE